MGLSYAQWHGNDEVWILNKPIQAAPFFRTTCVVKFTDGKVAGEDVIDAD
jgi:hypothetical protein